MAMRQIILMSFLFSLLFVRAQTVSVPTQTGIASFYAKKFEGRKCSSGEIFRNDSLTAAHKTLAFGTWVKVTNLKNDSVVIVKINDRLPKKSKRKIDLTRSAAKQLNFISQGLAKVRIEVLDSLRTDINSK
jgi:rare lipoprotein A